MAKELSLIGQALGRVERLELQCSEEKLSRVKELCAELTLATSLIEAKHQVSLGMRIWGLLDRLGATMDVRLSQEGYDFPFIRITSFGKFADMSLNISVHVGEDSSYKYKVWKGSSEIKPDNHSLSIMQVFNRDDFNHVDPKLLVNSFARAINGLKEPVKKKYGKR